MFEYFAANYMVSEKLVGIDASGDAVHRHGGGRRIER